MLPAYAVADVYDNARTFTIKLTHVYGKSVCFL